MLCYGEEISAVKYIILVYRYIYISCPVKELCSLAVKSSLASKEIGEKTTSSQSQANSSASHFGGDIALYSLLHCGGLSPVRGGMTHLL